MNRIFIGVLLTILFQGALAQNNLLNSTTFGLKAGLNISNPDFSKGSDGSEGYLGSSWSTGVLVGLFMIVPVKGTVYIQPEYLYSQLGGEVGSFNSTYQINYFSMPVLLRWEILEKFAVLAGPQFGLVINADAVTDGEKIKIMDDIENRHFGAVIEVEFLIFNSVSVGARYLQGINMVDLVYMGNRYEYRYEVWQLSVAYKF